MAKAKKRKKISKAARTVNPRRRRKANRRRRVVVTRNPRRRTRKQNRRRNTRVVVVQPRHNRRRSRRNPSLFGSSITSKEGLKMIGGGLAGVVAAKFIPTLIPSSMSGITSSSAGRTVATGAAAVLAGYLAGKWDAKLGDAVLFGGLMQTASVALNAFLPSVYGSLGIGLGDFVPGKFAVPQNPMRQLPAGSMGAPAHLPSASGAKVSATRLASAYSPAY